jgi:hypothetical protein
MEDIDVWRTAQLLIDRHGYGAEVAATKHHDAMVQRGDWVGVVAWHRVLQAIAQLRRTSAPSRGAKQ